MLVHTLRPARSWLPLVAALVLFVGASSGGQATAGSGDPGIIFVSTTAPISGRLGDFLLLRVEPQMGSDQGRKCLFIDSDVFSLSSVEIGEGSGLPGPGGCGDAPDPMVFSPGTYTLTAGAHANAAFFDTALIPSPEREIQVTVNVDGVTQVQISGEALSRLLLGDVNCDGAVDAADALDILRNEGGLPVVAGEGCPAIGE